MIVLALGVVPVAGSACEAVPRTVLALYDSRTEGMPRDTRIHHFAELVLNHMGRRLVYHDAAEAIVPALPPDSVEMVLSWFDRPADGLNAVLEWIDTAEGFCDDFPKYAAIGEIGLDLREKASEHAMRKMGLTSDGATHAIGVDVAITHADSALIGFEADFIPDLGDYQGIRAGPAGRAALRIESHGSPIDLVIIGPGGGYLHGTAAVAGDGRGGAFWIVDPFVFFGQILDSRLWPAPDPTTLAGRRLFLASVSADGWLDVLPTMQFGTAERLASEALVDDLLLSRPDLPVTLAVIAGDLEDRLGGAAAERGRQTLLRALSLPGITLASQGYSDIRDWDFFASYDAAREAVILRQPDRTAEGGALVSSAVQILGDSFAGSGASALSRSPAAPRKYAAEPFSLDHEIGDALDRLAAIAGPDQPAAMFHWGGNARPDGAALGRVAHAGAEAFGGGGGVLYTEQPSLTDLWPFSVPVGEGLQVYDALSGDDAYTGHRTAPLHGFHALAQTLDRTEEPRRLKPFHLSFAAGSAVHFGTRRAVQRFLDMAETADVIPVSAQRHVEMVRGFDTMRAVAEGAEAWRIRDRGGLQTLRLDGAESRVLDLARSEGVLGARRKGGSLYIALDSAAEASLLVLASGTAPDGMAIDRPAPALVSSRNEITRWERGACSLAVGVSGVAGGMLDLLTVPGAGYRVTIDGLDGAEDVTADATGRLAVFLPIGAQGRGGASLAGDCDAGG